MKLNLIDDYKTKNGIYDEFLNPDNTLRQTASVLFNRLSMLSEKEIDCRQKRLNNVQYYKSLVRTKNETEYNLDFLPLFIEKKEWQKIQEGLIQRIKLYDLIAKDIYGEQKLLKDKVIPPALVYSNPNFLQMIWNEINTSSFVNLMSTDLIRNNKGEFIALSDVFQSPLGIGSTLENRIAITRAYPEFFQDLAVERIRDFFTNFRHCLFKNNPNENTGVVLLASEPDRMRRSEDAVLARYLQIQLVENDDLSIRGFNVYLKTLTGLKKINTIVRRVDDGMCDPLELRIDSGEGAVGLISAAKKGNVKIINALGAGVLESQILKAYLPHCAKYFLNENLIIKQAETYWLGEKDKLEITLKNPEKYIFNNAFGKNDFKIYLNLTETAKLSLIEKIMKNPAQYIAEEYIETSTVPYIKNNRIMQGKPQFRFFISNINDTCTVMPGGYGKVMTPDGERIADKDILIITDGSTKTLAGRNISSEIVSLSRAGGDLPSKAADNLFSLGKNIEKAELEARVARAVAKRLSDRELFSSEELPLLFKILQENYNDSREYEETLFEIIIKKTENFQGTCKQIRKTAIELRDRLSEDTWDFINFFGKKSLPEEKSIGAIIAYLQQIITDCAAFHGITSEGMTKGYGWRFLEIGKRISRGILTLNMIKTLFKNKIENNQQFLSTILEVSDSTLTYFRRYGAKLYTAPILDIMLCDETNPMSVAYQALKLSETIMELPNQIKDVVLSPLDKEMVKLLSEIRLVDVYKLTKNQSLNCNLDQFMQERIKEFENINEMLNREYLIHIPCKKTKIAIETEI